MMKRENVKTSEIKNDVTENTEQMTSLIACEKTLNRNDEQILDVMQALLQRGRSVVILRGNAGRNAELVPNTDGKLVKFPLAVNQFVFNSGASLDPASSRIIKETEWYDIEVRRGKVAQAIAQVYKGCRVTLVGQLRKRSYINRMGQTVNDTKVVLTEFWVNAA